MDIYIYLTVSDTDPNCAWYSLPRQEAEFAKLYDDGKAKCLGRNCVGDFAAVSDETTHIHVYVCVYIYTCRQYSMNDSAHATLGCIEYLPHFASLRMDPTWFMYRSPGDSIIT